MKRLAVPLMMLTGFLWTTVVLGVSPIWTLVGFATAVVGFLSIVLVHELGHVAIGRWEGMPLRWLAVGPVMVDFSKGRRVRRSPFGGAVGGCAVFDLGDLTDEQVGGALCRMSVGGPLASLLLAVVCLGLNVGLPVAPILSAQLQIAGGLSLLLGLLNAIPFRMGTLRSDGATFLTLLRGGERAASLVRAARLAEPVQTAARPAEWPAATVARMKETLIRLESPTPDRLDEWLAAAHLLYWHFLDRGEIDDAEGVLRRAAVVPRDPKAAKSQRYDMLNLLTALHLALWVGDGAAAGQIVARLPKRSFLRQSSLWTGTEAAILLTRGDVTGARKKARQARRRIAPFADLIGVVALEQRCWSNLMARAEAAIARTKRLAATPPMAAPIADSASAPVAAGPVLPVATMGRALPRVPSARPETVLWLERARPVGGGIGARESPPPFPFPKIAGMAPELGVHRPAVAIPVSSIPVALLKAAGATLALLGAMTAVVIAFGAALILLLGRAGQQAGNQTVGYIMLALGFAIGGGIAGWLWRQAGAVWGMASLLIFVFVFPLYVYKQNRGMVKPTTGEPVRRFRTMATASSMIVASILFFGLMFGVMFYQEGTDSVREGNRSGQVR